MPTIENFDVIVIGAGPSGAISSALLTQKGHSVLMLEREQFPRFSIGESLLPQCMAFIEEAGMLPAVQAGGFQFKNGAAFYHNGKHTHFDFTKKFSPGHGTTFQVQRAQFDKILADEAARFGVDLRYRHEITAVDIHGEQPRVTFRTAEGEVREATAKFLLDASGFGRVLPRLLDLEYPSDFPVRQACFATVRDNITDEKFDRNKILITTHPTHSDVWYWTIPFSNGQCSMGVIARPEFYSSHSENLDERIMQIFNEDAYLKELLKNSEITRAAMQITGYSCNVKSLHGKGFALLGNAGEFLDPVFSSGVTIAMKSASLAAALLDRQLRGETVDWEADFAAPLKKGVKTFRTFVSAWYDCRFQDVVYHDKHNDDIKAMISSVLAGYAWDENNPYVKDSERRMNVLAEICRST